MKKLRTPAAAPQPATAEITIHIPIGNRTPAQVEFLQRACADIAAIFAKLLDPANLSGGDA